MFGSTPRAGIACARARTHTGVERDSAGPESEISPISTARGRHAADGTVGVRGAGPRARRRLVAASAAGLALAWAASPAGAQTTQAGDVAMLELSSPNVIDFTLHATVPVPKGTFPRADGKSPFSVRDIDGALVPAQVEPVTWYPDKAADGADVVEVIARVKRPANYNPDNQVFYPVVDAPVATAAPTLTPTVQAFLGERDSLRMETRDVFNNRYTLDLRKGPQGKQVLKSGRWQEQTRYYGVMRPFKAKGGPTGTLNHLFGVHSYVTTYANEDVISVDLRVHNGLNGLDKQNPLDDPNWHLYFESLDIKVPNGWTVIQAFPDPMVGAPAVGKRYTSYPIVAANADGTLHVFPQQAQMSRRLVVTPIGNEARAMSILQEEWLGFVRQYDNSVTGSEMWSWWSLATPRFFPQNTPMPDLAHIGAENCRSKLSSDLSLYNGHMTAGTSMNAYPLHSPRLGWAHPWGVKYGGMTSGSEIFLYDGMVTAWGASKDGYRLHQLRHRMYTDRQPNVLYNLDGEPTQLSQLVQGPPNNQYVYMNFYMHLLPGSNDPFGLTTAPKWQYNYVQSVDLAPWYQSELQAHESIDMQHLVRYTHSAKVLIWLGNDALAKDDVRMQAELGRLSYHPYYVSPNQGVIVSGMLDDMLFVAANPKVGFSFGRGPSWVADTMAATYAFSDDAWRAGARPWFDDLTNLVWDGISNCNGFIQSQVGSKLLNGQYRARQSIEQAITENAFWGTLETVYRNVDPFYVTKIDNLLQRSVYAMIGGMAWDSNLHGPHSTLAVAPLSLNLQPYCGASALPSNGTQGGIDKWQTWSSFAYGYLLSGDDEFLSKALEMTQGSGKLNQALEKTWWSNLENRYAILALSQQVNYP